jgi:ATP dependent DNA ligase domain
MVTARPNGFIAPCIPTLAAEPPSGPDWVHEIKHDGYRLIVRGASPLVRLFTRRGFDWTDRYPTIAAAAAKLAARSFTIDGEAVVCGTDGIAVFDALHRRHKASDAIVYSMAMICGRGRSASGRRGWRSFWTPRPAPSSSMSTPTGTAPPCSGTPANWGSKASCRNGWGRPTDQGRLVTGSRSRTRTAQRCGGRARDDGNDGRFGTASCSGRPDPGRSAGASASTDLSDGPGTGQSAAPGLSLDPAPSTGSRSPVGPAGDRSTAASGPALGPAGRGRTWATERTRSRGSALRAERSKRRGSR